MSPGRRRGERGALLVGLVAAVAIMMILSTVAMQHWADVVRRDNEAEMMARAGVGGLTLVDRDYVEESNLQRQSLFDEADAARGMPKAVAAEAKLRAINSDVSVRGIVYSSWSSYGSTSA